MPDADGDDGHGVGGGLDDGKMSQSQLSKSSSRPWSREVNTYESIDCRYECVAVGAAVRSFSLFSWLSISVLDELNARLHQLYLFCDS